MEYDIHTFTDWEEKVVQGATPHRSFENQWRSMGILYNMLKEIVWRFWFSLNLK